MSSTEEAAGAPGEARRARLGERLKRLRKQNGWTLADVAARSGLAISTISKVERGRMSLTYDKFTQLAAGLELDVSDLFSAEGIAFVPGSVALARRGEARRHETETYVYDMLFPTLRRKKMTPMMGRLKAHDVHAFTDFVRHPGEEFLLVLEGSVEVHMEGRAPVRLDPMDSLYFDSTLGHVYVSAGPQDASILVVCTSPALEDEADG
ncbi:MAG TPA: XRE family transcriptional regulator [Alphaproteobacteria bacterium]|nr:XRE family transcriptional regulator [Alphaproteobacteria bacterium]